MKILFICGSLEPGRDGVGDYTRLLAGACAARGHDCTALALHDLHAPRETDRTRDALRVIRLPATTPWAVRLDRAADLRARLAPDWVSWQFVAYAFHPRGFLPGALLQRAADLRGARCHVMMHELWLGLEAGASWRPRLIGWLQRQGILRLLRQLNPDCVQTSNPVYRRALARAGIESGVLGLFGNVPCVSDHPGDGSPFTRWLPALPAPAPPPFIAVTFGTIHPQWQPAATIAWLVATARRLGRRPAFLALGVPGAAAPRLLAGFRRAGIPAAQTDELKAATVSHLLAAADVGIAPHPWALIGKSGAAAAMLDHGLPVLVPRDNWHLRGHVVCSAPAADPLLTRLAGLDDAGTDRWLARRRAPASALPQVADTFLHALQSPSGPPQPHCP